LQNVHIFESTLVALRSCRSLWLVCIFHYISLPHRVNTEFGVAIPGGWGSLVLRVLTQRKNLNILKFHVHEFSFQELVEQQIQF